MNTYYVTTSSSHPEGAGHYTVSANSDFEARSLIISKLGIYWCFIYDKLTDMHELDRGCHGHINDLDEDFRSRRGIN